MESFKIWVTNKKDREKVLKKMSRDGIVWWDKEPAFKGDIPVGCPIGFFVYNGTLITYNSDYLYFIKKKIKEISLNEYLERDKNQNIIIYRNGNKVIAKNKLTGNTAEAKCHPEDEFDFMTGAKLAFDRLIEKPKLKFGDKVILNKKTYGWHTNEKMTGMVIGIENSNIKVKPDNDPFTYFLLHQSHLDLFTTPQYYNGKAICINNAGMRFFKVGKIYEFIDGRCVNETNEYFPIISTPFVSIDELNERCASKFVELVE